ncbi:DIMBOA UDP-glucosyltransferase BX8 [Lolium perenne]|uniref:DIMBOA UDP-glucosyltransferase BX8 n=1 Tax=Lolium perenne TaxID=4522 RepID=UPI0021F63BAF|nr:DIMBOA UDP-glucosyltransferase BX8-like [Lolium perenne]
MALEGNAAAAAANGHDGSRRRHVLVFPLAYQGHINPMFRLAGILHARGFAITVFHTHFNAPDPARHPEYRFVPVPDGVSGPAPVAMEDVVSHIFALNAACEAPFRDRLAAVLEEYSRDAVACLIADGHLLSMVQVATRLAVPTLILRTGSAACFSCFLAYPLLINEGYLPVQESELETEVSELPPYRVRDLMRVGNHDLTRELLERAVAAVDTSAGLILNTFDALERRELEKLRQDLTLPVFDIGPLHMLSPAVESSLLRQDRSCLEWLDARPPASVLYVSFGSLACMSPRDLVETAWGIAGSNVPFLWVVRPGLVAAAGEENEVTVTRLPDGFEAATRGRGTVVAWAPQEEVLRHPAVAGFWTHCGWNSTTESVCEGVPMLCRPHFGDQMGNARYVEHVWRVGFEVGGELERGAVEAAIRRLVTGKDGAEMQARAGELKKAAKECTGVAGSSHLAINKLVDHMLSL